MPILCPRNPTPSNTSRGNTNRATTSTRMLSNFMHNSQKLEPALMSIPLRRINQARFFHPRNTSWQSEGKEWHIQPCGRNLQNTKRGRRQERTQRRQKSILTKVHTRGIQSVGVRIQNSIVSRGSRLTGIDWQGQKGTSRMTWSWCHRHIVFKSH